MKGSNKNNRYIRKPGYLALLKEVRGCEICTASLPAGPRPVLQFHPGARLLVAGQAPGRLVHESGIPFDDKSGDRLRKWMGVDRATFYDSKRMAILPMGFCYPGTGKNGDLPPRPECAAEWRKPLLDKLKHLQLTLAIGQYAMRWHLNTGTKPLTEVVRQWKTFTPDVIPLPHPSPRNNIWLRKNPWFEKEVIPWLQKRVKAILQQKR